MALRYPSFRGYADCLATESCSQALARVLGEASHQVTAVMCAETLWWRCHRRLMADVATVIVGTDAQHLGHDGRWPAHRLTEGVRRGSMVYNVAQIPSATQAPATRLAVQPPSS